MAKTLTTTSIDVKINGKDYKKHVMFPFKVSNLLDEQLDEASLTLIGVPEKNFKPLTDVIVTLKNDNKTQSYSMLVASDKADEIPTGSGRYKHELYLIEQTKYLECFISRSIGFVNPLQKEYATIEIEPSRETVWQDIDWSGNSYKRLSPRMITPVYPKDVITLPSLKNFYYTDTYGVVGDPYIRVLTDIDKDMSRYYTKVTIRDAQYNLLQEWTGLGLSDIRDTPQDFIVPNTTMLVIEYDIIFRFTPSTVIKSDLYKYFYYIVVL